ncbi:unnamed protein product, partial [Ectocarpus sp. 12 AP-2014]
MFSTGGAPFRSLWNFREYLSWFFRLTTAAKSSAGRPKQKLYIPNFVNFKCQSSDKLLRASVVLEILAVQSQPITPFLPTSERDTTPYGYAKDTSSTITTITERLPARDDTPAFLHHRRLPTSPVPCPFLLSRHVSWHL